MVVFFYLKYEILSTVVRWAGDGLVVKNVALRVEGYQFESRGWLVFIC